MSRPIPKRLRDEFVAFMEAHDDNDLPDGAWFARLEEGACEFLETHNLRGDQNDAVHQYLGWQE